MGGFGSGRSGWKRKAEQCLSLDVNRLHRMGCLQAGYAGGWVWSRSGAEDSRIGLRCDVAALTLRYRVRGGGDAEQSEIEERIPLERTPCPYGGARPWFRCPGVVNGRHCGRRVGKLFLHGHFFLCRHCHGIAYASQSESRLDRLFRKRDKRRMALGAEPGCCGRIPPRPKRMWRRTYDRRLKAIHEADMLADEAFETAASRLMERLRLL